jgi:TolB protein
VWDVREGRVVSDRGAGLFLQPLSGGDSILVPTESRPHSAVWSPDGNALAFVLGNLMFGNPLTQIGSIAPSAIWTVALDGGAPTMVAGGDGSLNTSPAWMPDGRTVLFVSDRDGPRDVYAIRLDAALRPRGNPVRVTTGLNPHSVTLSADGRALAFAQLTFRTNIMEIPIPSSGSSSIGDARPLTSGNQIVENHGASLDGRWLAYDSNLEGNQDIYLVSTNGGEARRITTDPGDDFHPDPSPDGSEVVFYSTRFGLRDLFLISADGTGEIRLTDDPRDERHPAFSPDGLAIAFEAAWPRNNVYVITREAVGAPWSAPRQITTTTGRHPRWSRDGSRILYNTDANEIGIVTLSGEDHRVFSARSAGFTGAEWPLWSPDGRSVYFTGADSSGAQGLYSMPAEGGIPRVLIRFDDPSKQLPFSFSVSDDKVYLSVTQYDSDIFVTDIEIR